MTLDDAPPPPSLSIRRDRIVIERVAERGLRQWSAAVPGYQGAVWWGRTRSRALAKATRFVEARRREDALRDTTREVIEP